MADPSPTPGNGSSGGGFSPFQSVVTALQNAVLAINAVTKAVNFTFKNLKAGTILGNPSNVTGGLQQITLGATLSYSGTVIQTGAGTGDVAWSANSFATTIQANAVTFAKFQQLPTNTLVGNNTGGTANALALTVAQVNAMLGTGAVVSIANNTILGNVSGSTGAPSAITPSQALDVISSTRGSLLYRGAVGWAGVAPGTSGFVLTSNGPGADPTYQVLNIPWTLVKKTVDQTISSSTTFASDSALQFAAAANKTYAIRGVFFFSTPANNGGWKAAATGPTSPTRFSVNGIVAYDTSFLSSAPDTVAGFFVVSFNALLQTGANAGTFAMRFAQSTSNANGVTSCLGSYLEYAVIV